MTTEILSAAILVVFVVLLLVGAASTTARVVRYHRANLPQPRLLGRDRDLLLGLAVPFLVLALVRVVPELREFVRDDNDSPHIWYLLLTGLPPIYALAKYDWYELRIIERVQLVPGETMLQREDREVGDTRRELQERNKDTD